MKICGDHSQGETPGPIPNPEAKALHGDGTAPERVWESSTSPLHTIRFPPVEPPRAPGGFLVFPPPARTRGRAPRYGTRASLPPLPIRLRPLVFPVRIHSSVHPFLPFPHPFPPRVRSHPLDRVPTVGPGGIRMYFVKLRWTCPALNLNTVGVQLEHRRRLVPCFVVCLVYFMRECLFR